MSSTLMNFTTFILHQLHKSSNNEAELVETQDNDPFLKY